MGTRLTMLNDCSPTPTKDSWHVCTCQVPIKLVQNVVTRFTMLNDCWPTPTKDSCHVIHALVKCLSRWSMCPPRGPPSKNVLISGMQLGESINPMNTLIYTKQRKTPGQTEMNHNWPRPFVFYNNNNKMIMM